MSEIVLTAVPGIRLDPTGALLRVLIVPRLSGPGATLADHGLDTWPARITGATFRVALRTSAGADLPPLDLPVHTDVAQATWDGFFAQIAVRPFGGQKTYDVEVAPTSRNSDQIIAAYQSAAQQTGDPGTVESELAALSLDAPAPPPDLAAPVPDWVPPDFHRALALLREHPIVLRQLGFIVEVTIPRAAFDSCGANGQVSVSWPGAPATFDQQTSPQTAFVVQQNRFLAAPAGVVSGGLVDLSADVWTVVTVDVDAAIARLGDAQQAVSRGQASQPGTAATEPVAMPALRSAGLQLVHRGRGEQMAARNARAVGNAGRASLADGPALTAEDLVLGYRLDMRLPGRDWHSLTRRVARYTVGGALIADGPEEGHVRPGSGVLGTDGTVRFDEVVTRWDGRNLAVPRPSLANPTRSQAGDPAPTRREMPYDFQWQFAVDPAQPAVPSLRFGGQYDLRARIVDIAGGGLELNEVIGSAGASQSTLYGRFEPVPPPEIPAPAGLLRPAGGRLPGGQNSYDVDPSVLGPGGAVDRLVVRSDPSGDNPTVEGYPDNSSRIVLPPPATFDVTEQHGRLDGTDVDAWRLARRALAPPRSSAQARGGRNYTWLPDHAADGVSITAIPVGAFLSATRPSPDAWDRPSWPDMDSKTIQVTAVAEDGTLSADWTAPNGAVVDLPPGAQVTLEVASTVHPDDLKLFAVGQWIAGNAEATEAALAGRHPVITPSQRLHLVHAVRKPLWAPSADLNVSRGPGDTFAEVGDPSASADYGVHVLSTLSIDVLARWNEWVDAPTPIATEESLESLTVDLGGSATRPIAHEFGDTKHRHIVYGLTARSRFRDYFDATDPETAFVNVDEMAAVHIPSSARPVPPVIVALTPAYRWDRGSASADQPVVHRREGGWLRVELAAPWYTTGEGERLGVVVSPGTGAASLPGASATMALATAGGDGSGLVTTMYRDPVFFTGLPGQPDNLSMVGGDGARVVIDAESGMALVVVPFEVFYADGRRFADIGFGALGDQTYSPMARLSVVRFQEHSLGTLHASMIVTSEIVSLPPSRTLTVNRSSRDGVAVSLEGPFTLWPNRVEVRLEAAEPGSAVDGLTAISPQARGWTSVVTASGVLNTSFAPIAIPQDGQAYRLVVREIENIPISTSAIRSDALTVELAARTVFADVVLL